ncbi:MAG: sulfur carrier protein ThiS [Deltaproteobacteria bacterium]|nr:sulfur carrier protein ThiS [Deltaproteobacteria bacterium]
MRITLNGEAVAAVVDVDRCTVDELLIKLALPLDRVAVERNGVVVLRGLRPSTEIKDGDVLEVVTLVGGG